MKKFVFFLFVIITHFSFASSNNYHDIVSSDFESTNYLAQSNQPKVVSGYIFNSNTNSYVYFKKAAVTVDYYGIHVVVEGLYQVFDAVRTNNNSKFKYTVWVNLGAYGGYWLYFNL